MARETINVGAVPLALKAAQWKGVFALIQDPHVTMEQSQKVVHDSDTPKVIPNSLVGWIKGPVKSVSPDRKDCLTLPINAN